MFSHRATHAFCQEIWDKRPALSQRTENKSGFFFLQWDDGMVCCTAPHMFGHVNLQLTAAVQRGEKGYSTGWLMAHIWEINKCKSQGENSFFRTSFSYLLRMSTCSWLPPMDRYLFTFCQFSLEDERRLIGRNLRMPTGQRCRQVLEGTILSHKSLGCLILIGQSYSSLICPICHHPWQW